MPLARCWLCGFWLDCKLHLLADIGRRLDHGVDEVRKLPAVHGAKLEPSPLRVRDESGIGKGSRRKPYARPQPDPQARPAV